MNNQSSQEMAIKFWLDCSKDNLIAAKAMFKAGRWSLCMFMCQQTTKIYNRESAFSVLQETREVLEWFTKKTNLPL